VTMKLIAQIIQMNKIARNLSVKTALSNVIRDTVLHLISAVMAIVTVGICQTKLAVHHDFQEVAFAQNRNFSVITIYVYLPLIYVTVSFDIK
jgi:hypothetical protein